MESGVKRIAKQIIREIPYGSQALDALDTIYATKAALAYSGAMNRGRKRGRGRGWGGPDGKRYRAGYDRRNVGRYRRTQKLRKRRMQRWCCAELRNLDGNNPAEVPLTQVGAFVVNNMWQVEQGTGVSQREGRKIIVKSVQIKLSLVYSPGANVGLYERVRVCLYQDRQCNGSTPSVGDIHAGGDKTLAFRNLDEIKRFKIWKDKVMNFSNNDVVYNTTAGAYQIQPILRTISWRIRNLNIVVNYNGTDGLLSEIRDNAMGVIGYTSQGRPVTCVAQYRIRYDS